MKRKKTDAMGRTPRKPKARKPKDLGQENPTPAQQAARVVAGLEPLLFQPTLDADALSARILHLETLLLSRAPKKRKPYKKRASVAPEPEETVSEPTITTAKFVNRLGVDILLTRYARSSVQFSDDQHADRLCGAVRQLAAHNIKPTSKNIKSLGIGAGTIQRFRPKVKAILLEAKQQARQDAMQARERLLPLVPYRMTSSDSSDADSDADSSDVDIMSTHTAAPFELTCDASWSTQPILESDPLDWAILEGDPMLPLPTFRLHWQRR